MAQNKTVLVLGKLPPPYMGPSIATKIILNSSLKEHYHLLHINTKINESLNTLGKWSLGKLFDSCSIYLKMLKVIARHNPDIVWIPISQSTIGFLKDSVFIFIAKMFGRNVVLHLRGSDFKNWINNKASRLTKFYVKRVLKSTQGMIVLGNNLRHLFEDYYPQEKIFVVPNGANYHITKIKKSDARLKILYLANLQPSKGIEDSLAAIKILKDKNVTDFYFDVVGSWRNEETKNKCLALVAEHQLPVTFFPADAGKEKFRHLGEADIFIFTPREPEGHPWVIVEAMAAALPIISTNKGAIVESVGDGENGFIVPAKSPERIAEKLLLLITDADLRAKMSVASFKKYSENFTEEKMVERLIQVFNNVLSK